MNKEEIRHFKSLLRQGSLRHVNILLNDKFQKELLNIIKDYEKLQYKLEQERNIRKEAIEYVEKYGWQEDIVGNTCSGEPMIDRYMRLDWDNCNELLEILNKEVK